MHISDRMPREIAGRSLYRMRFHAQDDGWRELAVWDRWHVSQIEAEADARDLAAREWPSVKVASIVGLARSY